MSHEWSKQEITIQTSDLCARVFDERLSQEKTWGRQNIHDLQKNSTGVHEIGRSYRSMAKIFKYQCDLARDEGRRSMDLVLLEEVFEALEKMVEISDATNDLDREALKGEAVAELVQVAAVALKWAGIIERGEPRHG